MVFDVLKKILGIDKLDFNNKNVQKGIDVANKMVIGSLEQGKNMHRQRERKINKMMKNLKLIENNTGSRNESPEIELHRKKLEFKKNAYDDAIRDYEATLSNFYRGYEEISKLIRGQITACDEEKNSSTDPHKEKYNESCKIGANLHKPYIDLSNNSGEEESSGKQYTTINDIEIKECNDLDQAYSTSPEVLKNAIRGKCNISYENIEKQLEASYELQAKDLERDSKLLIEKNIKLRELAKEIIDDIKNLHNDEYTQNKNQIVQTRDSIRTKLGDFRNNYDEYVEKEEDNDNPFKNDALINARIQDMKFKRNAETLRLGIWLFAAVVLIVFTMAMIKRKKN